MAILGVEAVIFGVDDLDACARFWGDFGLIPIGRSDRDAIFEAAIGPRSS